MMQELDRASIEKNLETLCEHAESPSSNPEFAKAVGNLSHLLGLRASDHVEALRLLAEGKKLGSAKSPETRVKLSVRAVRRVLDAKERDV